MHTPTLDPNTIPTHENTLWGITSKISELLDSEAFFHQSQELERLFTQLNDTLNAKVNKAWYDYSDYEQRLLRWEEELEAILQQDQALKVLYENFLKATEFAPHLKQALWGKLLFDKLIELWPPAQEFSDPVTFSFDRLKRTLSIPPYIIIRDLPTQASSKELGEAFSKIENTSWVHKMSLNSSHLIAFIQNKIQAFISFRWFSHLWNVRSIDLRWNDLWKLDEPRLHAIFSHLSWARTINLSANELWQLDKPRLQAIFSHLWNVRSIDLSGNSLCELDEPSLNALFSHLGNMRSIDLSWNDLWILDLPRLQTIFSHLWDVRSIGLRYNDIWHLDEPSLQSIFSHLKNVRKIDLWYNNLWELDEPRLQAIFSHMSWVRSIELDLNNLWELDKPRLQAIFSHLIHIEEVILKSQEEVSKLESLFPNLIGKFKIQ